MQEFLMCSCDGDPPEFYDVNIVKGRKQHKCCECLSVISVGESQQVASGKWEGDFAVFRTCMKCVELRKLLVARGLECWAHGYLLEDLEGDENLNEVDEFKVRRRAGLDRIAAEKKAVSVGC